MKGAYIKDQRGRYGLSVARLADAVGVSLYSLLACMLLLVKVWIL